MVFIKSKVKELSLFFVLLFLNFVKKKITKEEFKGMLGKENVVIIDVRTLIDLKKSNQKIQGAVIEDLGKVETWMAKYPQDKTVVFYCS